MERYFTPLCACGLMGILSGCTQQAERPNIIMFW